MNTTTPISSSYKLRMSDPRLPLAVSKAAIELDNASRGEQVDFEATRRFTDFLHESLQQNVETTGVHSVWLDANTVDVVGHALIEFEGAGKVRTVQDVFDHAWALVMDMEKASEVGDRSDLSRLRRFCVAFGNSLLSHRASLKQEGPSNPHRR
jgi:hypothetical protein